MGGHGLARAARVLGVGLTSVILSASCGTSAKGGGGSPSGGAAATGQGNAGSGGAGSSGAAGAGQGSAGSPSGGGGSPAAGATGSAGGGASGTAGTSTGNGGGGGGGGGMSAAGAAGGATDAGRPPTGASIDGGVRLDGGALIDGTLFYVALDDGTLTAFRQGTWEQVAMWSGLPVKDGIRGIDADPDTGILYVTHGGAGSQPGHGAPKVNGGMAAWSLLTNSVVFDVPFTHGVDQPSVGQGVVYVPAGEFEVTSNLWYYVKSSDGSQVGTEMGGLGPHDTIFRNGHRYYGGTQDTYLYVLGLPITKVGPSPSTMAGVRPFTVNAAETRVYITWTDFRGFSVGDLTTGKILKTTNFGTPCMPFAPSHGVTLSPDNSEVYVLDFCTNQLRVFDSSDASNPKGTIALTHNINPGTETSCAWDCAKDGWLLHSRDGKYVYVGNSGDVIDTATQKATGYIPALANSRHGFLEMIWSNGAITGTSTHVGLGY
jgi:YVTN family beta-propeller protein